MSVRKKGNKWYCRFQIDGIRYERRCIGATDEKSAKKCEVVIMSEVMHGNYKISRSEKKLTLNDGIKVFLEYSKNKLSHNTDLIRINKIIEYFGKNKPLENISVEDINVFKQKMKLKTETKTVKKLNPKYKRGNGQPKYLTEEIEVQTERSNATINRYCAVISKMFNLLIADGKLVKNPCKFSPKLRENNYKIRYLKEDEQKRLFNCLDEFLYIKPIIILALYTGMRKGEILNLKWSQIDFKNEFIDILKSKSGKERKIPIAGKVKEVLSELGKNGEEFIFINPETNKPYNDIKKSFSSLLKKAQIENFRFHDFRHTVATRLVESGVDLLIVKEILGHSNIETTMRYAHPVPELKLKAILKLNEY
ncbi:MAG: site-specific integrase [bacterium]|nr:site-specific integrase [bacterium]